MCVASAPLDRRPEDFAPSLRLLQAGFTEGQVRDTLAPMGQPESPEERAQPDATCTASRRTVYSGRSSSSWLQIRKGP